jgi:hypothetical protein
MRDQATRGVSVNARSAPSAALCRSVPSRRLCRTSPTAPERSGQVGARGLEFDDQPVDMRQEFLAVGMRRMRDQLR